VRVKFPRGATHVDLTGSLKGYRDGKTFILRVRPGQTISTEQISQYRPVTVWVTTPAGGPYDEDMDMSCHNRRKITPTVAGDYRLEIKECEKADRWRGTFRVRVAVR